ncbi:MAG: beta-ketoacyl-ACP synthase II [Gammaproteobacteria bacterium]|nr:MAG: beta-ketoacyl-ACP synthase II [Gammaproteobacteria bacterium]
MTRRVVITAAAGTTSLGSTWDEIGPALHAGRTGIRYMHEWDWMDNLSARLGGPADGFRHEKRYPRKQSRSMGRVAVLFVDAAERALAIAGLTDDPVLSSGRAGVAAGSSFGSTPPCHDFVHFVETGKSGRVDATSYIRMMSHTGPVNLAIHFGLQGRVYTTSSACTSGSQGIGYAYEAIRHGEQDVMLAGGADEFCVTMTMVFDRLYATSSEREHPERAVRPFDAARDGLVIGEAAGMLILEDLDHALARGATPLVEITGYATNCDGNHISQPNRVTQERVMREALEKSGLDASALSFISAHGTATPQGDTEESHASHAVYGGRVPFHSLKGHFGHTLGACAAIETWLGIEMLREGCIPATANLVDIDPACAELDYVAGSSRTVSQAAFACNNFAFGGINTSLVFENYAG